MVSRTGSRSSHDLAPGKGELVISSPVPFPEAIIAGYWPAARKRKGGCFPPSFLYTIYF